MNKMAIDLLVISETKENIQQQQQQKIVWEKSEQNVSSLILNIN